MNIDAALTPALEQRKKAHLYRERRILATAQGPEIKLAGKSYLNFCSNDYLGLANHPELVKSFKQAADEYGVGSGASHLVVGHSSVHHQLEEALAEFVGRPKALLFSSGYMANLGVVTALLGKNDSIFEDRLNHASLLDAGILCGARFQRFRHNDVNDLKIKLGKQQSEAGRRKLVVVDGVFSMDGDLAPLPELAALCQQEDAWLMVDDAHGLGVLGEAGRGTLSHFKCSKDDVPVLMGTLGKSFGTAGAFVAGSEALIDTLVQFARTYIYTTALPPAVAAASLCSLELVKNETWRREKLKALINQFRQGAKDLAYTLADSATAIQPILVGEPATALALSQALQAEGILITAIRPPTVPKGTARLRVTLSAAHSEDQVKQLLNALEKVKTLKA
ncbi:MAG TPA: 8-amino-7-oxononanoate synthase [Pseudomonadales bacterium]